MRPAARALRTTVDVVALAIRDGALATLLVRSTDASVRERWALPWDGPREGETLEQTAARVVHEVLGGAPSLLVQSGATAGRRHPSGGELSIAFLALLPPDGAAPAPSADGEATWAPVDALPPLAPRQRAIVDAAGVAIRTELARAPIAFHLLPALFTLTELQRAHELLLGRRLHKASFRRALRAAALVEPTDQWRAEGRGRPAQLYRFAPRRRPGRRRAAGMQLDGWLRAGG